MEICHYRGFGSDIFTPCHICLLYDIPLDLSTVFLLFHAKKAPDIPDKPFL